MMKKIIYLFLIISILLFIIINNNEDSIVVKDKQIAIENIDVYQDKDDKSSISNIIPKPKITISKSKPIIDIKKKIDIITREMNDEISGLASDNRLEDIIVIIESYIDNNPVLIQDYDTIEFAFLAASNIKDDYNNYSKKYLLYLKKFHKNEYDKKCFDFYYNVHKKEYSQLKKIVKNCLINNKNKEVIIDWVGVSMSKYGKKYAIKEYNQYRKKYKDLPKQNLVFSK